MKSVKIPVVQNLNMQTIKKKWRQKCSLESARNHIISRWRRHDVLHLAPGGRETIVQTFQRGLSEKNTNRSENLSFSFASAQDWGVVFAKSN